MSSITHNHECDGDCTLDEDGCCTECGVYHGDPCEECGGRGFHLPHCSESEEEHRCQCGLWSGVYCTRRLDGPEEAREARFVPPHLRKTAVKVKTARGMWSYLNVTKPCARYMVEQDETWVHVKENGVWESRGHIADDPGHLLGGQ
jgi:hypothetical protein